MARKWRRLYTKLVENEDLAMAGEECEFAERLFFRMIATCDDYGRLPGSAFGLASRACPGIGKSAKQIMEAVEVLAEHNLIERYQVDGNDYIHLPGWFEHQAQKWFATGSPEYPAPPEWEPPASLLEWLAAKRDAKGELGAPIYPPSRYGLDDSILDSLPKSPTAEEATEATPEATHGASIDATSEAQEIEKEVEKINDNDRAREEKDDPPRPRAEAYPLQADPSADTSYLKQNYPCTAQWLFTNCKRWSNKIRDRWLAAIVTAIESASDEWITSDQQAAELLATHPPKGAEENLPSKWLERVEKEAGLQPAPPVNVFAALINRTPEEQERIDAQAHRMWEEERAEWAASGGGLL